MGQGQGRKLTGGASAVSLGKQGFHMELWPCSVSVGSTPQRPVIKVVLTREN